VDRTVLAPDLMRRALALAIGLALAACTTAPSGSTSGGTVPNNPAPASEGPTIEGFFDVGGHRLFMQCQGAGSPTVVFLTASAVVRRTGPQRWRSCQGYRPAATTA
jgi:hypothetical protein